MHCFLRCRVISMSHCNTEGGEEAPAKRVRLSQLDLCTLCEVDRNSPMSAKLFLGHRLRRLRRDHEMSQTDMALSLGISPSYLNHLERNQRPVTAPLLLRLAEHYEVDVRSFAV